MPSAVVMVAGKAAPEAGKKRGRIKDPDGVLYQADPAILDQMHIGQTYQIGYKDDEFKGFKFRVIETVKDLSVAPAPSTQHGQFMSGLPAGVPMVPAPSAINRDELIFVEALIKPWMEKIQAGDQLAVEHAVNVLRGVFANTFGRMPKWKRPDVIETGPAPAPRPDDVPFNDEIPY